jgi:hypothetical protein
MVTRRCRSLVCAGTLLAVAATTPSAWANLLVDPGFEVNPLDNYLTVLNDFTTYEGVWGVENATITGLENGVTPPEGVKMLRMDDDGIVTTQAFQVTDVNSYAGVIDSGSATVTLSALFDVDSNVPAAAGSVYIQFFSAANYGSQIGTGVGGPLALDSLDTTWELATVTTPVPVGTRWLVSQVYYSDASLLGNDGTIHPGYVDAADLSVVPEPATLGLLLPGALAVLRRRSR